MGYVLITPGFVYGPFLSEEGAKWYAEYRGFRKSDCNIRKLYQAPDFSKGAK